jgi:hypothetical protein
MPEQIIVYNLAAGVTDEQYEEKWQPMVANVQVFFGDGIF